VAAYLMDQIVELETSIDYYEPIVSAILAADADPCKAKLQLAHCHILI
jgi:hypothetical protein